VADVSFRGGDSPTPSVHVIVVVYGDEPMLDECLASVLRSDGVTVRLIIVDNGCTRPDLGQLTDDPHIDVIRMPKNVGFAAGVNAGARLVRNGVLTLVNSDVVVPNDALARLCDRLEDPEIGIVMPLVLRREDGRINSAGNPLHLLGYSWAGQNGSPTAGVTQQGPHEITIASGATLALRHATWERLGGLPEPFFLYQEDVDLSIGCHQAGLKVMLDPTVKVDHDYSWDRNAEKLYFAERNRLVVLLTRYPRAVLIRLLPIILLIELGTLLLGGLPRARRAKIRGYGWLIRNARWVRERRRCNGLRSVDPTTFLTRTVLQFDRAAPAAGGGPRILDLVLPYTARGLGLIRLIERAGPTADIPGPR